MEISGPNLHSCKPYPTLETQLCSSRQAVARSLMQKFRRDGLIGLLILTGWKNLEKHCSSIRSSICTSRLKIDFGRWKNTLIQTLRVRHNYKHTHTRSNFFGFTTIDLETYTYDYTAFDFRKLWILSHGLCVEPKKELNAKTESAYRCTHIHMYAAITEAGRSLRMLQ